MKFFAAALLIGMTALGSTAAFAGADDTKWVAKCVSDNSDAKVSVEIVAKYCTCMNNKMDDNETKTITQWEKTHPTEMKACEKEAGWK
ncbi:hypothetical protein CU669_17660 [Paramagnetospirillum kuznetsovii]|uniref:Uncharacterized protein n=1 Tax=Paramagnetospirillum kuznetsovii TaxID=2053833 RepID=A0A364NU07_9PROT|nr:hypothetical protein [Paramagnetospirillum kuznetsovii]RAU20568.1 hypothetical protein CU669_17660 [Paramagnetospirillum kuznetsovii]